MTQLAGVVEYTDWISEEEQTALMSVLDMILYNPIVRLQ